MPVEEGQHGGGDVVLEDAEGEPETEPAAESREWSARSSNRIFLIFNIIMQEKYGPWGRRITPQFEHEAECWVTGETLKKTFFQLRLLCLLLDQHKFDQVETVCMCLEGAMGNDNHLIKSELEKLEQGHVDDMTLTGAIRWLYMRFRDKCLGEIFDKIKWAAEVYGSGEETMRVSQERALEAISDRMEMAFIRGDLGLV